MADIIDWPEALRPASVEWGLFVPQTSARSAFDGSVEANTLGAPRWWFTITTGAMRRDELPQWEALIDALDGRVNRVRAWDWRRELPLGAASGSPVVRVAGDGASLQTQGWTPSIAGILRAGSYMGINGELKRLAQTIDSDASGRATIRFKPPMRAQAPAGVPLVLAKPTALFQMTSEKPSFKQDGARFPTQTLSFEEVPA